MDEKKQRGGSRADAYRRVLEKAGGRAVRPFRADGYVNLLNRYGTSKDSSEAYRFTPETVIPDEMLTTFYEGNGLFAKIIDAPAEEALKHDFELDGVSDQNVESFLRESLDELDWEETAMTAIKWARLFGGAIAVMLINDGRGVDEPLNWKNIQSIDDIRVYDRSVINPDYESMYQYDPRDPFKTRGSRLGMPEYYHVNSRFGSFTVHESRCLVFRNGTLPENSSNSIYQFWGMPEYVRIHRAIQDAEISHRSAPKMLTRSVQPVYKMKDLSAELATEEGESKVLRRLQTIDMARGMMNSITIDSEGEDYDFRTFTFSGVAEVIDSSCNYLSALTNIPQTILFGRSPSGMNSTGDSDMENWYSYVARIQKRMVRSNLRYLLSVISRAGVSTGEIEEAPEVNVKFKPLWVLNDREQAELDKQKADSAYVKAQTAEIYVNMQAIDPSEVRAKLADSSEFDVETMLDDISDEDLAAAYENMMASGGEPDPADSGAEGSTPDNAPAATKLPQDMSEKESSRAGRRNADWLSSRAKIGGGAGSGDFGHEGRPGKVGGSAPGDASAERCGKISSRLTEISVEMEKCFADMASGERSMEELIRKVQALSKEGDSLKTELEELDANSKTNISRRLCKEGHPTKEQIMDSLPEEWRDAYSFLEEQSFGAAFSAKISDWCGEGYREMKEDAILNEAITLSTAKWSKGKLYRGMSISDEALASIAPGSTVQMRGLSSWSSDISPAMSFATTEATPVLVVDKTSGERNAIPIAQMSGRPWEKEVIYGKDQRFLVKSVTVRDVEYGRSEHGSSADFSVQTVRKVTVIELEATHE